MKKTKEEILKHFALINEVDEVHAGVEEVESAMDSYKDQELEELQYKYEKLKNGFYFVKNDLLIILKENVGRVNEDNFHELYNEQAGLTE